MLHVAEDPDRARTEVGPAIVRGANQYLELAAISTGTPAFAVGAVEELEAFGMVQIVDPDSAVAICRELGEGTVVLQPRFGGMAPDAGWSSLELFATKVMPNIGSDQGGTS